MTAMTRTQTNLLLAFFTESQKEHHDYVNNITADKLEMSWDEFGKAFRYLYEQQFIWIYNEQSPAPSDNPPHLKNFESAFISSLGKEIALQLLAAEKS